MKPWIILLLLAPLAAADHVDSGIQWACGPGGRGLDGHPDQCGIDPIGGDGVGSVGEPAYGDAWIEDDERVLGVVINGDARAIPVKVLDRHEILNDDIGGIPVAVTYCPLCGSGLTFDRRVAIDGTEQTLTFTASGFLFKHDLVMWDAETGTLWTQILGEPIATLRNGHVEPDHMRASLDTHPTVVTTWGAWASAHPESMMLEGVPNIRYGGAYAGYDGSCQIGISGESRCSIDGLHPKVEVLGVEGPGGKVAFPHAALLRDGGIAYDAATGVIISAEATSFRAYDAGRHVFNATAGWTDEDGHAWDLANGTRADGEVRLAALDATSMYWFAWQEHHPDTVLWSMGETDTPPATPLKDNGKLPGFTIGIVAAFLIAGAWWLRRR